MVDARIDGKSASLEAAAERSAEILSRARLPVIAGLGADIAGARVSILLAERIRGVYDHLRSHEIFTDLDVVRQAGAMLTTPSVARLQADVLVFIGDDLTAIWPELIERLAPAESPLLDLERGPRKVIWIAPPHGVAIKGVAIETVETSDLHTTLAALRARVAGRPIAAPEEVKQKLDEIAGILNKARFGVAVWGPRQLDRLSVEMVTGLILDLNKTTRFTSLPLGTSDNAFGVVQTSGWSTGFPVRTSFGRGYPEHDSWRFDADRLVESGEADAALWISAYSAAAPPWKREIPIIALVPAGAQFSKEPAVRVDVGQPGVDYDSAEYAREVSSIVAREASHRTNAISVASFIASIAQQIGGDA
ncbi:tungsten formylmethanofuran dehydrogenase [Methylocella tundrae]|uniref:Tungsten-containing formylmethanofuran dehydrogenase, subunit B n=1 Tax=Methylocella tundrae TaxID=227605 RepID=A0A4U8Z2I5_METTU|nr:tungsten formylmethanofuran dehydrogenase [Methylocella tundrae]WPP03522.1 tungsten formylmethanofuran dehydrogenase [Methylocella tundrae]VFU09624.1 Tungsten-containing formylmethanofuran dehydrogenase, subunit B [Methylocella tundrae]